LTPAVRPRHRTRANPQRWIQGPALHSQHDNTLRREGSPCVENSMILPEVSVRRPVFAIMMTAALLVLGAFSYRELGLDLMPKTDSPVVNVNTTLPGASAEEVETQITKRVEEVVNTISGIDELRDTSDQASAGGRLN